MCVLKYMFRSEPSSYREMDEKYMSVRRRESLYDISKSR